MHLYGLLIFCSLSNNLYPKILHNFVICTYQDMGCANVQLTVDPSKFWCCESCDWVTFFLFLKCVKVFCYGVSIFVKILEINKTRSYGVLIFLAMSFLSKQHFIYKQTTNKNLSWLPNFGSLHYWISSQTNLDFIFLIHFHQQ